MPLIVPVPLGLMLQVTAVLPVLLTVAVNCWDCEADNVAVAGATLTVTAGLSGTVEEALLVLSARLVAVTVTVCWLLIAAGAV